MTVISFDDAIARIVVSLLVNESQVQDIQHALRYLFVLIEYDSSNQSEDVHRWNLKLKRHLEYTFPSVYKAISEQTHKSFVAETLQFRNSFINKEEE